MKWFLYPVAVLRKRLYIFLTVWYQEWEWLFVMGDPVFIYYPISNFVSGLKSSFSII